jgi:aspartokinase
VLDLSSTTVVIVLAALAALTLTLVLLASRKPRRAEKWEKAEIMKQLLALSEREESMQRMKQATRTPTDSTQPAMRQASARSKPAMVHGAKPKTNAAAAGKAR